MMMMGAWSLGALGIPGFMPCFYATRDSLDIDNNTNLLCS